MTWLHVPPQYMPAPATADSNSPSESGVYEPWLTLSGTPTRRPSSWKGWVNRGWVKPLFGMTLKPLAAQRGVDGWISSLPVSRASRSPRQVRAVDLTMTVGFGLPLQGSSLRWNPATSSWRTCQALFEQDYQKCSMTLPASGSMRNGDCSQRPTLVPLTSANGSGAWPTPVSHDAKSTGPSQAHRQSPPLVEAATHQTWATPRASMNENRTGKNAPSHGQTHGETLAGQVSHQHATTTTEGPNGSPKVDLNPFFVASLMGLPPDWLTHSTSEVTVWCRRQLQKPSDNYSPDVIGA